MARKPNGEHQHTPERRFPPERVSQFLFELRNALALTEGEPQKLEDLEQLTGRSRATIGSWYEGAPMQQVEFVLSLLERLPSAVRNHLFERACRPHPNILHSTLAHDPLTVMRLEAIIRKPKGLTLIRGQDILRAFVLAAIGNSIQRVRRGKVAVCGINAQVVPWAEPRGVTSMPEGHDAAQLRSQNFQIQSAPDGSCILLGGEWSNIEGLDLELGRLAGRCNVIATDASNIPLGSIRPRCENVQVLTVARVREQPEWLAITFQADRV